jgi:hypothetical protein
VLAPSSVTAAINEAEKRIAKEESGEVDAGTRMRRARMRERERMGCGKGRGQE